MPNEPPNQKADSETEIHVPVQVQCEGYRCMAYQDKDGVWFYYHGRQPIAGSVRPVQLRPY